MTIVLAAVPIWQPGSSAEAAAPRSPLSTLIPTETVEDLPEPLAKILPKPVKDALPAEVKKLLVTIAPKAPVRREQPDQAQPHTSASTGTPPFWGMGAWVDLYDYGHPGNLTPEAMVDDMAARGVRTVYVQTARWNSAADIVDPGALGGFVERAHERGMKVVGWYMPGFGDLDLDIRRSLAVFNYRSPGGQQIDGFAPDIEDRAAVGGSRDRFNEGIVAYSQRLRAAVPPGTILGAIVPDARNNLRAPARWAGFPWPEIARDYDVILPMAYWSVVKPQRRCLRVESDAATYTRDVIDQTTSLMGTQRPIHIIGGIADCVTPGEVAGYAAAAMEKGAIGGGLYDFMTNTVSGARDALWSAQSGLR